MYNYIRVCIYVVHTTTYTGGVCIYVVHTTTYTGGVPSSHLQYHTAILTVLVYNQIHTVVYVLVLC